MLSFEATLKREAYFESMNPLDIKARAAESRQETFNNYIKSVRKPTPHEQKKLKNATVFADELLKPYHALAQIPWRFLIANDYIEAGFPHTHHDIIIIPKTHLSSAAHMSLINTLIHEKMHIFQRLNPPMCHKLYLDYWKLKIAGHRDLYYDTRHSRRNPDTNHLVYKDETQLIQLYYKNKETPSLQETFGDPRDHPHEIMAYVVTHIISPTSILQPYFLEYIEPTTRWLNDCLAAKPRAAFS